MPLAPPSRAVLRIAALGAATLVLGAAAYEIPPRMELGAGPNPRELVGTYRVEPATPRNPTAGLTYVHLLPDGRARYQVVKLTADTGTLVADVRPRSERDVRWTIERPDAPGPLGRLFMRPQLCTHVPRRAGDRVPLCTPFERDPYTGDIAYRLEPTVLHRQPVQRLTRLRIAAMPD